MTIEYAPDMDDSDILSQLYVRAERAGYFVYEDPGIRIARVGDAGVLRALGVASPYELEEVLLMASSCIGLGDTREAAVKQAMDRWTLRKA